MKKLHLMFILIIYISLIGCSTLQEQAKTITPSEEIKKLEQKIADLEKENKKLREQLELDNPGLDIDEADNKNDGAIAEIKIGDTIKTDRLEITIKKIELTYDVLPDVTDGFYTHYPADSGHVYIHIDTDVKNIQKQKLNCDDIMLVEADYNNGFTYHSSAVPESTSTGFTYASITSIDPLQTLGVRFLINCPQEVEETNNPLFLIFTVDKEKYKYTIR